MEKTLHKVNNLINATDEDYSIIVLANSPTVNYFKKSVMKDGLFYELLNKNVEFKACKNALLGLNINEDDLEENIIVVKAGVLELTKAQINGYAYIRI